MQKINTDKNLVMDLGTNTAILSVIELIKDQLIITYEKSITTRIGQDLSKNNSISDESISRNIRLLTEEIKKIKKLHGVNTILGMATEWVRRAVNGRPALESINRALESEFGQDHIFEAISGDEEAIFTLDAVKHIAIKRGIDDFAVCDIGGGSTEFSFIKHGSKKQIDIKSLPLGVVILEETFGLSTNKNNEPAALVNIKEALCVLEQSPKVLFSSGGTATTIATMIMGIKDYDPVPIEGFELTGQSLNKLLSKLRGLSLEEIKSILVSDPDRSDLITAGVILLKTIIQKLQPQTTLVTTLGPRHGYLMKRLNIKQIQDIKYRLK